MQKFSNAESNESKYNEYESKYFILAEFPTNFPKYAAKYESSKY